MNPNHSSAYTEQQLAQLRAGRVVHASRPGRGPLPAAHVPDVTAHPAFRNPARMVARLYDALHEASTREALTCPTDTGSGGYTHRFFRVPRSRDADNHSFHDFTITCTTDASSLAAAVRLRVNAASTSAPVSGAERLASSSDKPSE